MAKIPFRKIAGIAALFAALFAAFIAAFPALFGLAFGGLVVGALVGGIVFAAAFVVLFLAFFTVGLLWSFIPRNIQFLLIVLLFVVGLVSGFGLDFVAAAGLVMTVSGVGPEALQKSGS